MGPGLPDLLPVPVAPGQLSVRQVLPPVHQGPEAADAGAQPGRCSQGGQGQCTISVQVPAISYCRQNRGAKLRVGESG